MALTQSTYQAARIGADVRAGVSGSASKIATRATNKFTGRRIIGGLMGGSPGAAQYGGRTPSPVALGVGLTAGLAPGGSRSMVAGLYNLSRSLNDIDTYLATSPSGIATRWRNKLIGRQAFKRIVKQATFRGKKAVFRNLDSWVTRVEGDVFAISQNYANRMEQYAKANAPWTDRTGAARRGLFGRTREQGTWLMTGIAHSVDYGPALELGYHGQYAILKPTRNHFAPMYFRDVKRTVGIE